MEPWMTVAGMVGAVAALTWALLRLMPSSRGADIGKEHEDALHRYDNRKNRSTGHERSEAAGEDVDDE
jgi:hypothetical protein